LSEALYGLPEVAPARAEEKTVRGWIAAVTERLNVAFVVAEGEPASATVTVMGKLPAVVGVPEMIPLLERVRPAGRAAVDQTYGAVPPAASRDAL
jgi:hypothetical protein